MLFYDNYDVEAQRWALYANRVAKCLTRLPNSESLDNIFNWQEKQPKQPLISQKWRNGGK